MSDRAIYIPPEQEGKRFEETSMTVYDVIIRIVRVKRKTCEDQVYIYFDNGLHIVVFDPKGLLRDAP